MECPICTRGYLPSDASEVTPEGKDVLVRGSIRAVIDDPRVFRVPPFSELVTVTVIEEDRATKHLKFADREELLAVRIHPGMTISFEGHMHRVDGKDLVFDVRNVLEVDR